MDSTKPASRSTRRCFETVGCDMRSWRSISPTDCCDATNRLNIARRLGSAMISNGSTVFIYSKWHILVKVCTSNYFQLSFRAQPDRPRMRMIEKPAFLVGPRNCRFLGFARNDSEQGADARASAPHFYYLRSSE